MWFGDSLTIGLWPEMWLHEGFATWSEWIWSEHEGNKSAQKFFDNWYQKGALDTFWNTPPLGLPGPERLFSGVVYIRGGMTLQALRVKIGDFDFFRLLKTWATQNRYGNVTTPQFEALAEQISGQDLDHFFDVWLREPGKPTSW
jgi:aminopeptidase N